MKNRVIIFIAVSSLFIGVSASAKSKTGFSMGMFGSYATDPGVIEYLIRDCESASNYDNESISIPGTGFFARYEFKNNLFIRTGAEAYVMTGGGDIKISATSSSTISYDYQIDYFAMAVPLFLGINASPDKGKTNFYGAFGPVVAAVDIKRELKENDTSGPTYKEYSGEETEPLIGFGGLLGVEKQMTKSLYFLIEFAFYNCEGNKEVKGDYKLNGVWTSDYNYTEKYGLPRQQIRLGLRCNF